MNGRDFAISTLACGAPLFGQPKVIEPDLSKLSDGKGLRVINRAAGAVTEGTREAFVSTRLRAKASPTSKEANSPRATAENMSV